MSSRRHNFAQGCLFRVLAFPAVFLLFELTGRELDNAYLWAGIVVSAATASWLVERIVPDTPPDRTKFHVALAYTAAAITGLWLLAVLATGVDEVLMSSARTLRRLGGWTAPALGVVLGLTPLFSVVAYRRWEARTPRTKWQRVGFVTLAFVACLPALVYFPRGSDGDLLNDANRQAPYLVPAIVIALLVSVAGGFVAQYRSWSRWPYSHSGARAPTRRALPRFDAIVLAGGSAKRLGGQDKPALEVAGRSLVNRVLDSLPNSPKVVVVGPRRHTERVVTWIREEPQGGGPVAAIAAGLPLVATEYVAVLAADLPFLDATTLKTLRDRAQGHDGALLVDGTGRDQLLIGVWRAAALRDAVAALPEFAGVPLHRLVHDLDVVRVGSQVAPGQPVPWLDCDTEDDLRQARGTQ